MVNKKGSAHADPKNCIVNNSKKNCRHFKVQITLDVDKVNAALYQIEI